MTKQTKKELLDALTYLSQLNCKNVNVAMCRNQETLEDVVEKLRTNKPLEQKYHNHELSGTFKSVWECHIKPDWLLLYFKDENVLTLTLIDTGTHSDIFKK